MGIRIALSPQADIATEPRWPRIDGTFGANPALAAQIMYLGLLGVAILMIVFVRQMQAL